MSDPGAALLDPSGFPDPGRPRFCARCGTAMQEVDRGDRLRPECPACGWVYYAKNALGAAILVEREGKILLVQRAHDPFRGWWMLPAGFVEYGEDAAGTAVREAMEECHLSVTLEGVFGTYFGTDDPRNPAYLIVYFARPEPADASPSAGDDAADARWFSRDSLPPQIAFEAQRQAIHDWAALTSALPRTDPAAPGSASSRLAAPPAPPPSPAPPPPSRPSAPAITPRSLD